VLALIGGYAGMIWLLIELLVGGFQEHAFLASLVRRLYTTEKRIRTEKDIEDDDKRELEARMLNRRPTIFSFAECWYVSIVFSCCCCFRSTSWYKQQKLKKAIYDESFERLEKEIDMLNLIQSARTVKLVASVALSKRQRGLIPYTKSYHIAEGECLPEAKSQSIG
jgi:hypothetical protein